MNQFFTQKEALQKLEHFCAYQERCHAEVVTKLYSLKMSPDEIDTIVVQLIENNFLNETRFACSFARGKHRIKSWGRMGKNWRLRRKRKGHPLFRPLRRSGHSFAIGGTIPLDSRFLKQPHHCAG